MPKKQKAKQYYHIFFVAHMLLLIMAYQYKKPPHHIGTFQELMDCAENIVDMILDDHYTEIWIAEEHTQTFIENPAFLTYLSLQIHEKRDIIITPHTKKLIEKGKYDHRNRKK